MQHQVQCKKAAFFSYDNVKNPTLLSWILDDALLLVFLQRKGNFTLSLPHPVVSRVAASVVVQSMLCAEASLNRESSPRPEGVKERQNRKLLPSEG